MYDKFEMHTLGSLFTDIVEVPIIAYKIPRWAIVALLVLLGVVGYLIWLNRKKGKEIKEQNGLILNQTLQIIGLSPSSSKD